MRVLKPWTGDTNTLGETHDLCFFSLEKYANINTARKKNSIEKKKNIPAENYHYISLVPVHKFTDISSFNPKIQHDPELKNMGKTPVCVCDNYLF